MASKEAFSFKKNMNKVIQNHLVKNIRRQNVLVGGKFRRQKIFVGKKIRQSVIFSSLFTDEISTDKVNAIFISQTCRIPWLWREFWYKTTILHPRTHYFKVGWKQLFHSVLYLHRTISLKLRNNISISISNLVWLWWHLSRNLYNR